MLAVLIATIAGAIILFALFGLVTRNGQEIDKTPFREAWQKIVERSKDDAGFEIAIINADKLLDVALRKKRYAGQTMGERLISAKQDLTKRQQVWNAHKLRNRIVHEENVRLDKKRVHEALAGFESALKDLGAL
jgi:hypothetical protein